MSDQTPANVVAAGAQRAAYWSWRGAKTGARAGANVVSALVRALPGSRLSRRLTDLVPLPPEPAPRGLFYVAHVALELLKRIESRSVFVLPGGVAFFFLLGLLPATASIASIYGLVADPAELMSLAARLTRVLPIPVADLISAGLERAAAAERGSLGLSASIALFMTLMSANWGTKAMAEALNIVFDRREHRNYFQFTGVTLLITTLAISIAGAYAWLFFRVPADPDVTSLGARLMTGVEALAIWGLITAMIGALYGYGPAPDAGRPPIPILTPGAAAAALAVLVVSWFLTDQFTSSATFVRNFGALASIAAVVLWAWVIIVIILLGAEIVEIREEESRQRLAKRRTWFGLRRPG